MAATKIISKSLSQFVQPPLDGTVEVLIHSAIAWIAVGVRVYIKDGGIYEVKAVSGIIYTLQLKTMEAQAGDAVKADILFPVQPPAGAGKWVREW